MANCGIMRCDKRKMQACRGIQAENNRTSENQKDFVASDIDWTKTDNNIHFVKSNNFRADIKAELHAHGIDKWRKDAVTFIDGLYTASPEFFQDKKPEEVEQYFKDCLEYHKQTYGDHVINAVVHVDEGTPHMHVVSVPIVEKEAPETEYDDDMGVPKPTEKSYKLSAKELMGCFKDYCNRQDSFFEQVSKQYGLERGEKRKPEERRKHLTVLEYKEQEKAKQVEQLDKALNTKEARLTSIDGEIKAAKDLRKEKSNKGLFGRSKDEITIPYSEYRTLQKTARAVDDVQLLERVLGYDKADFEKEKAQIQPRLDEVARKEQEAQENLYKIHEFLDKQEDYIIATADQMAQDKVNAILGETNTSREGRMEEFLDSLKFKDGTTALERFEELEEELEQHLHNGISR